MVQLDFLRGVAILLVLFTHSIVQPDEAGCLRPVLTYLRFLGPTGVDLFFVLSGFLVGGLLFRELRTTGRLDVRRFLIRRAFRIWPSYFVFLAALFVGLTLSQHKTIGESLFVLWPNLLHVQNYFGTPRWHTWSLAVEEHFYLTLPLVLGLLITRPKSRVAMLPWIAVGVFILCALLRLQAYAYRPTHYNPYTATHLRMDSLFFGVLLAYFYHLIPQRLEFAARSPLKTLGLGLALLFVFPLLEIKDRGNLVVGSIGSIILYVGYGCILLAAVHTPVGKGWLGRRWEGFTARTVAFIGYFSYPIYLWHIDTNRPVAKLVDHLPLANLPPELRWLGVFGIYVLAALAAGVVFGLLLEKPSLALRDRLFPTRTPLEPSKRH